ncbi:MAG: hypothetical protein ABIH52_01975, partial [Candidatus Aenigmatarchaeota archaeon]
YMPCEWSNTTNECTCKATNIFGNRTQSLSMIDNEKVCESCGGKWIVENYCEGNMSVPTGRCEQKGNDEKNCDKVCFACDYAFDGSPHNSSGTAKEYCYGNPKCKYINDSTSPNGYGFCKSKEAFKKGIATDCRSDCGSCTYFGNVNASTDYDGTSKSFDTCNSPKCYCQQAYEFGNVKCKWIADSSSNEGGYCLDSSEKTCADACDRCYTKSNCMNKGRSAMNATGSCEWSNPESDTDGECTKGGQTSEVCWDAIDNDNDNLIDCIDPECYVDSFCGFVSGDCFGWYDPSLPDNGQSNCENAQLSSGLNCTWMSDPWGSWCDFPGANCWKYDGNQSACEVRNTTCDWNSGMGGGGCEQDWSVGEACYMLSNNNSCSQNPDCTWTTDTWCQGDGNTTSWCQSQGGWCDPSAFAPKNCWEHDTNSTSCGLADGCVWETNEWGASCDVDWASGQNCYMYGNNESWCTTNGCAWKSDQQGGGWCDNKFQACWGYQDETTCSVVNSDYCFWDSWNQWSPCNPKCFNPSLTVDTCGTVSGCVWSDGWCMEDWSQGGVDCWNETLSTDSGACDAADECRWKDSGWCNPKGFAGGDAAGGSGVGASTGMDCWKYDGNQTGCVNSTLIGITCSWMTEPWPFCEPDWSANCWEFDWNVSLCDQASACYWQNTSGNNGYCSNIFDQCWSNMSYSNNQDDTGADGSDDEEECDANPSCSWSDMGTGWCEPSCFSATTEGTCTGGCRWINGWCNSPGMNDMYEGMEGGAPVMVAFDECPDSGGSVSEVVDICGVGMKDMGDSLGFGIGVVDFSEAGVCNGQKIGFGNFFGNGNETTKLYIYLDTDGSTSGGCSLSHDSSQAGYEFMFKYIATWNDSQSKVTETFNTYKCSSGSWKAADITLSAWKEKMCGEIQGMMIALKKSDLDKFPTLYNSEKDMRIYAATADKVGNASTPSDWAGPGWVTPGAIDFTINGFFEFGADTSLFEDIMKKGYVEYEDCFNNVDDDNDGSIDCADWSCQFAPHCTISGVNDPTFVDTSMPRIMGMKIEEYTDAALIIYDTNKPTNGTLYFYENDSTCSNSSLNGTIYDIGIWSSNVREHKLWHYAPIYNDDGVASLDHPLTINTNYYYKLKMCDYNDKCSVSACTSFKTAETTIKCGYCNFVTMIKAPAGWNVYYDLDKDGTYEHWQGNMCGPNAGMKTNYTTGRSSNIKMNNSDGGAMWFYNVTLTKTGLTSNTRNIDDVDSLIFNNELTDTSGNAVGLVGMPSTTRDKIVNNMHPEVCQVRIPSDGTCDELWHCDDDGDNCVDMTAQAGTGTADGNFCIWNVPYCEFSTWASGEPGTYSPPGGGTPTGGSPGSGAATATTCTESWTCGDWSECVDGTQTRTCTDANACNTTVNKSAESQTCTISGEEAVCGNGVCERGENSDNCLADCPLIPDACTPGVKKCSGSSLQECVADGTAWSTLEICPYGCENNACKAKSGVAVTDLTFMIITVVVAVIVVVAVLGLFITRRKKPARKII